MTGVAPQGSVPSTRHRRGGRETLITKAHIIAEIRRTAAENGGKPLGRARFQDATGIRPADWEGRFWSRWGEAVTEAGLEPNTLQSAFTSDDLLDALIGEVRRLERWPTSNELKLARREDASFPSRNVFDRFGNRAALARAVIERCQRRSDDCADVIAIAKPIGEVAPQPINAVDSDGKANEVIFGQVYLLKIGKHYKIGRSNAVGRRERELAIQMPERHTRVHVIQTDDPVGIERYWHQRFADRRVRPDAEWFLLTAQDVAAFKRRKFQ